MSTPRDRSKFVRSPLFAMSHGRIVGERKHRYYTDEQKAKAIVLSKLVTQHKASVILGINYKTVHEWVANHHGTIHDGIYKMAEDYQKELEAKFKTILDKCLLLAPDKLDDAKAFDLIRGAAIAFDKLQILKGAPTQIIHGGIDEVRHEDRIARLNVLMEQASARRAAIEMKCVPVDEEVTNTNLEVCEVEEWGENN